MKIITAKIPDSTHLELSHPVSAQAGELIHSSIPDDNYANEDTIYDEL